MIKFKIQGIVYLTFLIGKSGKYHFTVKEAKNFSIKDTLDQFDLTFEISKEDGKRLLEDLRSKAKKTFETFDDNPLVISSFKKLIYELSKEVE